MPNDLNEHEFISFYLCQYDYITIVTFLLKNNSFNTKNKIDAISNKTDFIMKFN